MAPVEVLLVTIGSTFVFKRRTLGSSGSTLDSSGSTLGSCGNTIGSSDSTSGSDASAFAHGECGRLRVKVLPLDLKALPAE